MCLLPREVLGTVDAMAERAQAAVPVIGERTASPALTEGDTTESDLLWVVEVEASGALCVDVVGSSKGLKRGVSTKSRCASLAASLRAMRLSMWRSSWSVGSSARRRRLSARWAVRA